MKQPCRMCPCLEVHPVWGRGDTALISGSPSVRGDMALVPTVPTLSEETASAQRTSLMGVSLNHICQTHVVLLHQALIISIVFRGFTSKKKTKSLSLKNTSLIWEADT